MTVVVITNIVLNLPEGKREIFAFLIHPSVRQS